MEVGSRLFRDSEYTNQQRTTAGEFLLALLPSLFFLSHHTSRLPLVCFAPVLPEGVRAKSRDIYPFFPLLVRDRCARSVGQLLRCGKGDSLLLDDGKLRMTVMDSGEGYVNCRVDVGGKLSNRKGVNTPTVRLPISAMTPKV